MSIYDWVAYERAIRDLLESKAALAGDYGLQASQILRLHDLADKDYSERGQLERIVLCYATRDALGADHPSLTQFRKPVENGGAK